MQQRELISVVVPAHNEAENIANTVSELSHHLGHLNIPWEVLIVDDGSTDGTWDKISRLSVESDVIKGIRLSRNFGKEAAILAGLAEAQGSAVITIDADLQHPPTLIPEMISRWKSGAHVIHAVKRARAVDTFVERLRAKIFYKIFAWLGGMDLQNSSDYKLLDRRVVDRIVHELPERQRFYRGLVAWVGDRQESIYYDVEERHQGSSKWTIGALIRLATTAIASFTTAPLHIVTALGVLTLVFGLVVAADAVWTWFIGTAVTGFATLIITLLFLGSVIMISLGIIGVYIARIYEEVKCRPVFFVRERSGYAMEGERMPASRNLNGQSESRQVDSRDGRKY